MFVSVLRELMKTKDVMQQMACEIDKIKTFVMSYLTL